MKNEVTTTNGPPPAFPARSMRSGRLVKGMAGILIAAFIQNASQAQEQTSQGTHAVKFRWNASTSTDVTGYRVHFGTASGAYTSNVVFGNVTSGTVSGLAEGVTYYFAVSAFNADGLESDPSNEVSFKTGLHTSQIQTSADGQSVLAMRGQIGRQYDIEASEDLNTWKLIARVTIPDGGSLRFSDPDSPLFARRFYRTRPSP